MTNDERLAKQSTYYLVFCTGIGYWSKLLRYGFGHVWIITRDEYNWMIYNPTPLFLDWEIPAISADVETIDGWLDQDETVIKVVFDKRDSMTKRPIISVATCVTAVKYIVGLRLFCFTPYQLYKRLTRLSVTDKERNCIKSVEILRHGTK